jgi:hypothetical protein
VSIFNDEDASNAQENRARANPLLPQDMGPSVLGGLARGLTAIPAGLATRTFYAGSEALAPMFQPKAESIDKFTGTTAATDFLARTRLTFREAAKEYTPRPWQLGTAGSMAYGIPIGAAEMLLPALALRAAGPAASATAAAAYTTWVGGLMKDIELEEQGVTDKATRQRIAFTSSGLMGASAYVGAFAGLIPGLGPVAKIAVEAVAQAGANTGFGVVSRAVESSQLRDAGYPALANEVHAFGGAEMVIDAGVGLVFGGASRYIEGKSEAWATRKTLPPTEVIDKALADLNVAHGAIDTRPGLPASPADAEAHVEAMIQATEQMLNGDPVSVQDKLQGATFTDPPAAIQRERAETEAAMLEGFNDELNLAEVSRAETLGPSPKGPAPVDFTLNEKPLERLKPEQANVLRLLYGQAVALKPGFDDVITAVAKAVGGKPMHGPIKTSDRAVAKIAADYDGDATRISDLLRATVLVDDHDSLQSALTGVLGKYPLAGKSRNKYAPDSVPWADGYRDVLLKVSVNGHVAEVQVNTPKMLAAKERMHAEYARRSEIERAAKGRERTAEEVAEIDALNAKMKREYDAAYLADVEATSARKSASETGLPLRRAESGSNTRGGPSQAVDEKGEPGTLPRDTGMPSTSRSSTEGPKEAGSAAIETTPSSDRIPQTEVAAKPEGPKTDLTGATWGGAGEVLLGDAYVPVKWALVEADTLAPSVEKSESQARDRTRAASDQQVAAIAAALDFRRLENSAEMGTGAPTLSNAGAIIGGNARTLAIRRAYETGTAANYRQALEMNAERFGLDPAAIATMNAPALVRVLTNDVDVRKAAVASNEGGALRMSLLEQAPVDAERLPPMAGFHVPETGDLNSVGNGQYIMSWVRQFPGTEQAALVDAKGKLSQEGLIRMRNAILYRAYGESPTLARLVELTDPGVKNLATGLTRAGPPVAAARDAIAAGNLHKLDLTPDIIAAAEMLTQLRGEGIKVEKFLAQGDMLGGTLTETGRRLLVYFDANARSAKRMADVVAAYYSRLERAGNPNESDMFGGGTPTREHLLDAAMRDVAEPVNPTLAMFTETPDPYPGTAAAPRSREQALYDANGRVDDAKNEAPRALDAAVACEMA